MTATLQLGPDLALPLETITGTTGIVGQRGTGKTSTAVVLVEEAAAAGAHFAVVDPTGAWHGLRTDASGTGPGIECIVFGGHHGDLPLEGSAGRVVAELVVDQRLSVVLDLELLEHADQVRFVADFAAGLYHLNRNSLLLVLDEAHMFAPQTRFEPGGHAARCLSALTRVVTLGRRKGLGAVLISQRPAAIAKSVFEQAEVLVAHRLMGANDRKAIKGWLDTAGEASAKDLDALTGLEVGHAIVHAPTMGVGGVFGIREKRTFDSSATPKVGDEARDAPTARAEVDLSALTARLAESIERAKADDPEVLRQRIADLEQQVSAGFAREQEDAWQLEHEALGRQIETLTAEVAFWRSEHQVVQRAALSVVASIQSLSQQSAERIGEQLRDHFASDGSPPSSEADTSSLPRPSSAPPPGRQGAPPSVGDEASTLKAGARRMIDVLGAYRPAIGGLTRQQLALLARVSAKGGTFSTYLGTLRAEGLIEELDGVIWLSGPGAALRASWDMDGLDGPYSPEEVADLPNLKAGARRMLAAVMAHREDGVTRKQLAALADVNASGGTFSTYLGHLRSFGLIEERQRRIYPAGVLYLSEQV